MKKTIITILFAFLFGCTGPAGNNPAGEGRGEERGDLRLDVSTFSGEKVTKQESFDKLDAKTIEAKIRAIDWNDPKNEQTVSLGKKESFSEYLTVCGSLHPADVKDAIKVQWAEMRDGKLVMRLCQEIDSVDRIVAMFRSYFREDGKLKTLARWEGGAE
jgi:hypothetical protein